MKSFLFISLRCIAFAILTVCCDPLRVTAQSAVQWQRIDNGIPISVERLAAGASGLFAAVPGYGVYRSTNGGESWSVSLEAANLSATHLLSTSFGAFLVGYESDNYTQSVCFRFDGREWRRVSLSSVGFSVFSVVERSGTLYIATEQGYAFSNDRGESWRSYFLPAQSIVSSLLETSNGMVTLTAQGEVFRLARNAAAWAKTPLDGVAGTIGEITLWGEYIVARASDGGGSKLYRSPAGGGAWERLELPSSLPSSAIIRSMLVWGERLIVECIANNTVRFYALSGEAWQTLAVAP